MERVKCHKCGYEWRTRSKLLRVSCPSCGAKVWVIATKRVEREVEVQLPR